MRDGSVYIDGVRLVEPYLRSRFRGSESRQHHRPGRGDLLAA
jgi:hypothetical protein